MSSFSPRRIPPHWIIEGTPQARSKRLATSADGTASVMAWSCTSGRFNWHYAVDEILHIISGEVFVTDENGEAAGSGRATWCSFPPAAAASGM